MFVPRRLLVAPTLATALATGCTETVQGLPDDELALHDVAREGASSQSSTFGGYGASLAVDGDRDTFNHTTPGQAPARWELLLPAPRTIWRVVIHNRRTCCQGRSRDLNVIVLDRPNGKVVFDHAASTGRLVNPTNELEGPDELTIEVADLAARAVRGSVVRLERRAASTDAGPTDDMVTLNFAEIEILVPRL